MSTDPPTEWTDAVQERVDRRGLLVGWLVPGGVTVGVMAVGFALVAGVLFANESLVVGSGIVSWFALAVMFLFPHLVAGLLYGRRFGLSVGAPVAAGLAPVVVFVFAMALFGGPVATPLSTALTTLGAIGGWALVFATGMVASVRLTRAS